MGQHRHDQRTSPGLALSAPATPYRGKARHLRPGRAASRPRSGAPIEPVRCADATPTP